MLLGLALAASVLILCVRTIGLQRMLDWNKGIDVVATIVFIVVGAGTLGGVTAAIVAGLAISVVLALGRRLRNASRARKRRRTIAEGENP